MCMCTLSFMHMSVGACGGCSDLLELELQSAGHWHVGYVFCCCFVFALLF